MNKKIIVNVYEGDNNKFENGNLIQNKIIDTIFRIPIYKGMMGNFSPYFIRYKNKIFFLKGGSDYSYMHGKPEENYISLNKENQNNV